MKTIIKNGFILQLNEFEWSFNRKDILINSSIIENLISPNSNESSSNSAEKIVEIDAHNNYIIPSFINAHYHSHDNFGRGIGLEKPLELWTFLPASFRKDLSPREAFISTLRGCIDLISSGCTGVIDQVRFSSENELECVQSVIEAYHISGLRAIVVPVLNDLPIEETLPLTEKEKNLIRNSSKIKLLSADEQIERIKNLIREVREKNYPNIRIGIGPSGPQRCSDSLLLMASDLAKENNTILHMHVLETLLQREISIEKYDGSIINHLNDLDILGENVHLVHMIWPTDQELQVVSEKNCSIIYNPISNMFLGSGLAPISKMRDLKISIALGTDDICCNGSHNFFETMKWAALLNHISSRDSKNWMNANAAFNMATLGGSIAFGMKDKIGEIDIGMQADFVMIDPSGLTNLTNNPVQKIVYSLMPSNINQVWIGGEPIYENNKIKRFNSEDVLLEAKEIEQKRFMYFENNNNFPINFSVIEKAYNRVTNLTPKL